MDEATEGYGTDQDGGYSDRPSKPRPVREHFARNKTAYIVGGVCLVAGAVAGALILRDKQIIINESFQIKLLDLSKHETVIETVLERRGHPGNMVRCVETGEVFASQRRAGAVLGLATSSIRRNLSGETGPVKGLTFEFLGEAA